MISVSGFLLELLPLFQQFGVGEWNAINPLEGFHVRLAFPVSGRILRARTKMTQHLECIIPHNHLKKQIHTNFFDKETTYNTHITKTRLPLFWGLPQVGGLIPQHRILCLPSSGRFSPQITIPWAQGSSRKITTPNGKEPINTTRHLEWMWLFSGLREHT